MNTYINLVRMSYRGQEGKNVKTWIREDGTIQSWINYDEINKIINNMKHRSSAVREDALYKWVKVVEKSPNVITEKEEKKVIEALKTYR